MSYLVSVVGDSFVDDWKSRIISNDDPLAKFHTKFWGVANTAGEQEYDNDMEIDGSAAEDNDIIPGCHVLDISIRGAEEKIWVRADYIRIFEFAEGFYAKNVSGPLSPCLVITGQPGTGELFDVVIILVVLLTSHILPLGKSLWRWFALQVCCERKKPVIFYSNDACWLFVEEGVFEQPTSFQARNYKTVIWTLVDSVDTPSGLPTGLITHGTQHFIIYTTSPTLSRWEKLHQSMTPELCVMNPWTRAEIHRALAILLILTVHSFDCAQCPNPGSRCVLNNHRRNLR